MASKPGQKDYRVIYRAIADFSKLSKQIQKTKAELKSLRAQEAALNKASMKEAAVADRQAEGRSKIHKDNAASIKTETDATQKATQAATDALRAQSSGYRDSTREIDKQTAAMSKLEKQARAAGISIQRTRGFGLSNRVDDSTINPLFSRPLPSGARYSVGSGGSSGAGRIPGIPFMGGGGGIPNLPGNGLGNDQGANRNGNTLAKTLDKVAKGFLKVGSVLGGPIMMLGKLGFILVGLGSAIQPLIGMLLGLGGGAIAAVASLGPLITSLAGLPGFLSALVASFGGILTAISGVGAALKAGGAAKTATQQAAAAQPIAKPPPPDPRIRRLENRITKRSEHQALVTAEKAIANAQKSAKAAQVALTRARKDAEDQIKALREEVNRAGLNEREALVALQLAQEEQIRVNADALATAGERAAAALKVAEAEQNLADVRQNNTASAVALADAEAKGVEGSDVVVAAKEDQQQAIEELHLAQQALKDTQLQQALSALQAADADKQAAFQASQSAQDVTAAATATDAYAEALAKLSPNAQTFVKGLLGMKDAWMAVRNSVQDRFFEPLVGQLGNIKSLLPVVSDLLGQAAGAVGKVAAKFIELLATGPWKKTFGEIATNNAKIITILGDAFLKIFDAIRPLIPLLLDFSLWMAKGLGEGAKHLATFLKGADTVTKFGASLEKSKTRLQEFWQILKNLGAVFWNVYKAAQPLADWLIERFTIMTQKWADFTGSSEGQSKMMAFFESLKPMLSEMGGLIGDLAKGLMVLFNPEQATSFIKMVRDDILPPLVSLLKTLGDTGAAENLGRAIGSLIKALDSLMKSGLAGGIANFIKGLAKMVDLLARVASLPGAGTVIAGIGFTLGAIAALSFLTGGALKFLGLLLKIPGAASAIKGVFSALAGAMGNPFGLGKAPEGRPGDSGDKAMRGEQRVMWTRSMPVHVTNQKDDGKSPAGDAAKGIGSGIAAALGTTLGKSPPVLAALAVVLAAAGVGRWAANDEQSGQDSAVSKYADLTLMLGGLPGIFKSLWKAKDASDNGGDPGAVVQSDMSKAMERYHSIMEPLGNFFTGIATFFTETVPGWVETAKLAISNFFTVTIPEKWAELGLFLGQMIMTLIMTTGQTFQNIGYFFTTTLPEFFTVTIPGWLATAGAFILDFFTVTLPGWITGAGAAILNFFTVTIPGWVTGAATAVADFFTKTIPEFFSGGTVRAWINNARTAIADFFTKTIPAWASQVATSIGLFFTKTIPDFVGHAGTFIADLFTKTIPDFVSRIAGSIGDTLRRLPSFFGDVVRNVFTFVSDGVRNALSSVGGIFSSIINAGKSLGRSILDWMGLGVLANVLGLVAGGTVPGQGDQDTVPAMLTPGEFVVKKKSAKKLGPDVLRYINTFGELPQQKGDGGPVTAPTHGLGGLGALTNFAGLDPLSALGINTATANAATLSQMSVTQIKNSRDFNIGGDFVINNPVPEQASESLYRQVIARSR